MSLATCIDDLIAEGTLSAAQGAEAHRIYGEAKARRSADLGPAAADAAASDDTIRAMEAIARRDRLLKLLQIDAQARMIGDMAKYDGGKGDRPGAAALALLDHDGKAPYANVTVLKQSIVGRAHALMADVLSTFKRDLLGRMPNPATMQDVLRELFDEDSGNASAKELAKAWTEAAEYLRLRFNAAGGDIGKIEKWALSQNHDSLLVRTAGKDKWKADILPKLDRAAMQDATTGLPFTDKTLDRLLDRVFDTIMTDGAITREAGKSGGGRKLANSRAEHRFLKFRSADDWMAYRDAYGGGGTAFDAMIAHVDGMARDIAHMERLGPNPAASLKLVQDGIQKQADLDGRRDTLTSSAAGDRRALQRLFDVTSGKSAIPVNEKWARGLAGARAVITSAKLGGAVISAISDTGFQAMTRHFNGLPMWGAVSDHLKLMASPDMRRAAVRMGLIAEEAGHQAAGINRYMGESIAPGIAARLADGVLRVSGLNAWTQTGKWAYGMGELAHITENAARGFDVLDAATIAKFQRYGIDATAWDAIRAGERIEAAGADFIDPTRIADSNAGDKLLQMILTETSYAVPEVTARARAMTNWGEPGTLQGEVGRSMLQFKSFGVSMLLTHGRRVMAMSPYNAAQYAAGLFALTTMLGAVSLQTKELIKGRSLRPMDDWHFWKDAALQGGGFGIFGDFVGNSLQPLDQAAGVQRAGSTAELIAGPLVGAVGDATRLGISPFIKNKSDDGYGQHIGREVVRDLKGYLPGASLWYVRAAFERLVMDNLQRQIDPNHDKSWAMMERRATAAGQHYLWAPGEAAPRSPIDLGDPFAAPPSNDASANDTAAWMKAQGM